MTWILLVVIVGGGMYGVMTYNNFVKLRMRTKEAWADIDVQLKRRYDLIPNLVSTVKGYASHESETLEKVTQARSAAMGAGTIAEHGAAENMLAGALKSLFAVSESYPDLKANENFLELQKELSDTENKVQASRRFYNANARDLNTSVEMFPGNIIAGMFHFEKEEFFDLEDGDEAKEAVKVEF